MRISDWSSDVCSSDLPGRCSIRRCDGKIVQRTEVADHIPIGPFGRDAVLDLPIIEDCAFLEVHSDHLPWDQAALTDHGAFGNADHPGLRTHNQKLDRNSVV